ncbi:MAG: hypothetical protein E7E21_03965 [Peptostreptococcaceae bacterium]|nr:hypothetical protein [Peptostreptococcaceae bacterium]
MFNEEEMLQICKKYNIEVVLKEGLPLCMGKEMDEDFSFEDLMNASTPLLEENIICSSESFNFTIPIYRDYSNEYNNYAGTSLNTLKYKNEKIDSQFNFTISTDNKNKFAA